MSDGNLVSRKGKKKLSKSKTNTLHLWLLDCGHMTAILPVEGGTSVPLKRQLFADGVETGGKKISNQTKLIK